jgi:lauroyl/myristoyl acyltransferase
MRETLWAVGLSVTSRITGALPAPTRYAAAAAVGRWSSRFFPEKRRAVARNLAVINRWGHGRVTVDRVFENFGITLSDFLSRSPVEVDVEGRDMAEEALRRGHGALFLTSHLGNWELGGHVLSQWGWPVTAVYQPYKSRAMQEYIQGRRAENLRYLAVGRGAAAGMARLLGKGEAVAILADRPFGEDGAPVRLCGRRARLPRGPFVFACRFGAPVIPGFVLLEKPGRYRVVVKKPLWPRGKGDAAVQDLLDQMARVLEKYIALHGDQWYCFEPVWDEPDPSAENAGR